MAMTKTQLQIHFIPYFQFPYLKEQQKQYLFKAKTKQQKTLHSKIQIQSKRRSGQRQRRSWLTTKIYKNNQQSQKQRNTH